MMYRWHKYNLLTMMLLLSVDTNAQEQKDSLAVELYAEAYIGHIANKPENQRRPFFFFNYVNSDRPAINLAMARLHHSSNRFRTNLGLMAGDYAVNNLAGEEPWARHIFEANAGIRLGKNELWLDAGIMPSHIGVESAIGMDQYAATRSIVADNSPYYETGVRLSYQPNDEWYFAMLGLTGWQRVTIPAGQEGMSWGSQVSWRPNNKWLVNHSGFIGPIYDGQRNVTRIYSNLYALVTLGQHTDVAVGWDAGVQQHFAPAEQQIWWHSLYGMLRYRLPDSRWAATVRLEHFNDPYRVMLAVPVNVKAAVHHVSLNVDHKILPSLLLRAEVNFLQAQQPLFYRENLLVKRDWSFLGVIAYRFRHTK